MANLAPTLRQRYFDANGNPLAGGKLYSYVAGTGFATPKATYTTQAGTVANANPVILDSEGYADIWLGSGAYDFRLLDALNNLEWASMNVTVDASANAGPTTLNSADNTVSQIDMLTLTRGSGTGAKFKIATAGDTLNGVANARFLFDTTEVLRFSPSAVTLYPTTLNLPNGVNMAVGNVGFGTVPAAGVKAQVNGRTAFGVAGAAGNYAVQYWPETAGVTSWWTRNRNGSFVFGTGSDPYAGADMAVFDTSGNLLLGAASNLNLNRVAVGPTGIGFYNSGGGVMAAIQSLDVALNGWNGAVAVAYFGKNTTTSRSVSAAGTINASGADYAEYVIKADCCGANAKGAIVGIDSNGHVTDTFTDAHSFVIKSTDPAYVGGDIWGTEDVIGAKPDSEDTDALAAWEARLEAERQKYDRIAFSGQVPVNVYGARPGQYIVAIPDGDGGITGTPVNRGDSRLDLYETVGKVWRILDDGRAWVKVA